MQSNKLLVGIVVAALAFPLASFAQTTDIQVQAKSLMEQIQALQMQLKALLESTSANIRVEGNTIKANLEGTVRPAAVQKAICLDIKRDLRVGAEGEDVRRLQEMLAADPESGFRAKATGFFGPLTATAMAKYQERAGIASSTDGRVGPLTRAFFQRACGQGMGPKDEVVHTASAIRGEITAVTAATITVTPVNDAPRIVIISTSTAIKVHAGGGMPTTGTIANLTVGTMVMAEGQKNVDGSLTARMIAVGVLPPEPPQKPLPLRAPMSN